MRKTPSILEELNPDIRRQRPQPGVSNRGEHVITSAINLLEQIDTYYDEDTAKDPQKQISKQYKRQRRKKIQRYIQNKSGKNQKENENADK